MRNFAVIAFAVCCSVFLFCRNTEPDVTFPIEKQVRLDSTVVGVSTILSGLDVPWEITWGPDNQIYMTEQGGTVSRVDPKTGKRTVLLHVPDVYRKRSMGLLGMAVSPDFKKHPYIFLDYTYLKGEKVVSRLVRYTITEDTLTAPLVLLEDIPGANGHNGSRITIGADGKLILSTGDATVSENAQNTASVNGKILRLNIDGTIPADNPIPGSPVWSWGHRNIQGLAFGRNGILYSSEHGDATDDEVNIITKAKNYGWPQVQGYADQPEEKAFLQDSAITEPLKAWTPTIAPAGIDYYSGAAIPEWNHSLLLTTLKGSSLYVLKLDKKGAVISSEKVFFSNEFGRIRDVCVSLSGEIYLSTSNRDWNPAAGFPKPKDDRIIRITKLRTEKSIAKTSPVTTNKPAEATTSGKAIYTSYCESCHKKGGEGIKGTFPPLQANALVKDKKALIAVVLNGKTGPSKVNGVSYNGAMPAFKFLSDKDVAAVVTHIRTSFGNKAGAVTAAEVAAVRNAKK
ncbi:MAG TPA: PQQ-dependent sugar dehydrogenase [Flavisolibacter sp.]|jgi:glucose/arabinose dehydrogenase/cytochrome c5|nr:PQQ-dependent sugar dehydrogenase [Flavisolibacter sp.]